MGTLNLFWFGGRRMFVSLYPKAVEAEKVGEYPALAKSGAGYFYDDVLEYRVWCHPERGAPDEFEGEDYYYAFEAYEEALAFSEATPGCEPPLVLIRQLEWINEPEPGTFIHEKGERIAEWQVQWLAAGKRQRDSIPAFLDAQNHS
jgi:hypothetical protein